jgi:hypothetical protein
MNFIVFENLLNIAIKLKSFYLFACSVQDMYIYIYIVRIERHLFEYINTLHRYRNTFRE